MAYLPLKQCPILPFTFSFGFQFKFPSRKPHCNKISHLKREKTLLFRIRWKVVNFPISFVLSRATFSPIRSKLPSVQRRWMDCERMYSGRYCTQDIWLYLPEYLVLVQCLSSLQYVDAEISQGFPCFLAVPKIPYSLNRGGNLIQITYNHFRGMFYCLEWNISENGQGEMDQSIMMYA